MPQDPQEFQYLMRSNPEVANITNQLDKVLHLYPALARTIPGTLINRFCTKEMCERRSKPLFPYMIQRRIATVFWALTDTTFSPLRGLDLELRRRIMQNFANRILKDPYTTE